MSGTNSRIKRFLSAVALVAVAAATYVATASPGGVQAGPTARQFKALTAKVTKLQKQVTGLKKEADADLAILGTCVIHQPVGVDEVGTSTSGYLFGPPQIAPTAVTAIASGALNLSPSTEASPQHKFLTLNTSQAACVAIANAASTLAAKRSVAGFAAGHAR
jgi:hypothetical protein